ncbi:MAG: 50S ribosomal protein L25 [Planctomycetaceae bacterium]
MAEQSKLAAEVRSKCGTAENRRLRKRGRIPGVMYGHQQESQSIAVAREQLVPIIQAGHHVIDLEIDGGTQKAIFRDVQWNPFGTQILHFDLVRIDENERVEVEVPIELRGVSPGVVAGGILEQHFYSIEIECLAHQIPDTLTLSINHLEIGQALHVSDFNLPADATTELGPDVVVVQVVQPQAVSEEEEGEEPGRVEPELIGRKPEGEEEEKE